MDPRKTTNAEIPSPEKTSDAKETLEHQAQGLADEMDPRKTTDTEIPAPKKTTDVETLNQQSQGSTNVVTKEMMQQAQEKIADLKFENEMLREKLKWLELEKKWLEVEQKVLNEIMKNLQQIEAELTEYQERKKVNEK